MRRYLPLGLLLAGLAHLSGCGENPNRPSVVTDTPVNPPKTSARFIQVPWDISLFFNIPGGAVVADATTAATSGNAAPGDNLTGTFVNSTGFAGTITGVLTGNLEGGTFDGTLSTITRTGCTAERRFSGPINSQALNWSPGAQINDCGGASPLTSGIQAAAGPPTAPPPCTYEAAATGTSVPAAGGTGAVSVTAGEGCTWFATSSADFVTLSASQGSAAGSVQFTVAANTSTTERTAVLVVAGSSFTITQGAAPPCVYRLNGTARTFDAAGALGGVDMRTAAHCAWRAESDAPWLTITSGSGGTGDGTISYAVAANPTLTQRVGRITAQGEVFTVTQLGFVCQFTLTAAPAAFPEAGGAGAVTITTPAVCSWNASASVPWITLSGTTAGTGNGTVAFTVARNPGAARPGAIALATGQSATITQAQSTVGIVSGTVTNNVNGQPVSGATVAIGNLTATTATNGTYSIANVLLGPQTVRVAAPEFIARSDQITVTFQTLHNVVLTAAAPALTFTFSPNPVFPTPRDPSTGLTCGLETSATCFTYRNTIRNSGGATLSVADNWEINLYDPAGVQVQHNVYPASRFPDFYEGATSVPTNGTAAGSTNVFFASPSGGSIEIIVTGTDIFGRAYRFVSSPRLPANPFPGPALQAAPTPGAPVTVPAPRPVPGGRAPSRIRQ